MSPQLMFRPAHAPRFPRVSGDEPDTADETPLEIAFSPRERG